MAAGSAKPPAVPGSDQGRAALSTSLQGICVSPLTLVHEEMLFCRILFRKSQVEVGVLLEEGL